MFLQTEAISEVRCQESAYPLRNRLEEQREVCGCGRMYSVSENSSSGTQITFLKDVLEVCLVLRT